MGADGMSYRSLYVPSSSQGVTLHIREWGGGPQACILIHGFGQGAYAWSEVVPSLVPPYRALAVDLRGHGDSSWDPAGRYRACDHTADVLHLIERLGIERFVLIGHSLGADIAIRIAAHARGRASRLVMVDFGLGLSPIGLAQVRADFRASLRSYGSVDAYAAWLAERRPMTHPGLQHVYAGEELRAQGDGTFRLKCDPALADDRAEPAQSPSLRDSLAAVSCPVLLVRGQASAALSRDAAERTMHVLHDCALRTVNKAGHAVMTDNPEGFAAAIGPFLRIGGRHHPDRLAAPRSRQRPALLAQG